MGAVALYAGAYYFKYNAHVRREIFLFELRRITIKFPFFSSQDWTRKGGWKVMTSRKSVVPGDPGYPYVSDKLTPADYAVNGFKNSPI